MKSLVLWLTYIAVFNISFANSTFAQVPAYEASVIQTKEHAPKIGLVLSGGGARGAAHIGVLKVLEQHNIKIDYITGTSMGALVGGLYASGLNANEIELAVAGGDWKKYLQDEPPRANRPYRRKLDDFGFLVDFDLGVSKQGIIFPKGIVQGQNLEIAIKRLTLPVATIKNFDKLPIPFRAIATDLGSGEALIMDSGDLATAIRASMSIPGLLKPVNLDGRLLVDGGVVNNLPIQTARDMGADILIVVDISYPLEDTDELNTALDVSRQMLTIMMMKSTREQLRNLQPQDILISPDLGNFGTLDFQYLSQAVEIGFQQAQTQTKRLTDLSLSERAYSDYTQALQAARHPPPIISRVQVENESKLSPKVIEARLSDHADRQLDVALLEHDISNVYGFDTFETVSYHLEEVSTDKGRIETELHVTSTEKNWGPNYLQFGINLEDDFSGRSDYNLATRLTRTELNGLGGEFRVEAVLGETPSIFTEFYQPLDYAARWFVNPSVRIGRSSSTLFENGDRLAEFRNKDKQFSLAGGYNFSNWGEFRVGINRLFGNATVRVGDPSLVAGSNDISSITAQFSYDTIDNFAIPKSGQALGLSWIGIRETLGADLDIDLGQLFYLKPMTWDRHTLLSWVNLGGVIDDTSVNAEVFSLGGFFSLSGYAPEEISGKSGGIGRLIYYYNLNTTKFPMLDTPLYVGASVEAGYVDNNLNLPEHNNLLKAGSVFVMADTLIGPIYLGYGHSENNRHSVYLFLGQTF